MMEIIKRKILLEEGISRNHDSTYGLLTATTFNFNILLTQNINDIGLFTDLGYYRNRPNYSILIDKLNMSGLTFPFMSGATPPAIVFSGYNKDIRYDNANVSDWYQDAGPISAITESRLTSLKSYNKNNRYIVNFNIADEPYFNFVNTLINGVSRVTNIISGTTGQTEYVFDGHNDLTLGTTGQTTGFRMIDPNTSPNFKIKVTNSNLNKNDIPNRDVLANKQNKPKIYYWGEGWNNTNTSLSALTKEEYLMGIIEPPEINSDVFIDRGATSVMELHLKLSEIESLDHLETYGNSFYNIRKI